MKHPVHMKAKVFLHSPRDTTSHNSPSLYDCCPDFEATNILILSRERLIEHTTRLAAYFLVLQYTWWTHFVPPKLFVSIDVKHRTYEYMRSCCAHLFAYAIAVAPKVIVRKDNKIDVWY